MTAPLPPDAAHYLDLDYPIRLTRRTSSPEKGPFWLAELPDWDGCNANGATPDEAIQTLRKVAMPKWLGARLHAGGQVPEPGGPVASGRIQLNLPPALHTALQRNAERQNTNLNAWIGVVLARYGCVGDLAPEVGRPAPAAEPAAPRVARVRTTGEVTRSRFADAGEARPRRKFEADEADEGGERQAPRKPRSAHGETNLGRTRTWTRSHAEADETGSERPVRGGKRPAAGPGANRPTRSGGTFERDAEGRWQSKPGAGAAPRKPYASKPGAKPFAGKPGGKGPGGGFKGKGPGKPPRKPD